MITDFDGAFARLMENEGGYNAKRETMLSIDSPRFRRLAMVARVIFKKTLHSVTVFVTPFTVKRRVLL